MDLLAILAISNEVLRPQLLLSSLPVKPEDSLFIFRFDLFSILMFNLDAFDALFIKAYEISHTTLVLMY
jgi:hypothetical protein